MITKISGRVRHVDDGAVSLEVGPLEYEVLVPEFVRRQLQAKLDEEVTLFTFHFLEGNPAHGRLTPRLIGFSSDIEREFFDLICQVDGVGVKKALRAMVRPVREIATSIEQQDFKSLSALPGVGAALAERIVAKLRRKVPKFALMVATKGDSSAARPASEANVLEEAFLVLQSIGHSAADARQLVDQIAGTKKKFKDVQDVLVAVYEKTHAE
ncbi:MAG TPA: Holliday junction branch migration protein RuvA [Pirellulales bacterium]